MFRRAFIGLTVLAAALAAPIGPSPQPAAADTTFIVTRPDNLADANPGNGLCRVASPQTGCTLRAAIQEANATAGADTIVFSVGYGRVLISPASALPAITETVTIDGTTQPGFEGLPIVHLNGAGAGALTNGLLVQASNTVIKGLVINRFGRDGINVAAGTGSLFQLNFLGTDPTGKISQANGSAGLRLGIGSHTVGGGDLNTQLGGPLGGVGNLISSNLGGGIVIGTASGSNAINGNFIGTDLSGTAPLGNTGTGISMVTASNNQIGNNVIGANSVDGITISGSLGNEIRSNRIGTDITSTAGLGNGRDGVRLTSNAGDNTVLTNEIFFNGGAGIRAISGVNNRLASNGIFGNGGLGIDLGSAAGVTPNDADDPDAGANNLQNFPTFPKFEVELDRVTIEVTVDTVPGREIEVRYFSSPSCDASGNGEGRDPKGGDTDTTNASGDVQIANDFLFSDFPPGSFITATASDMAGSPFVFNTSEFSACFAVPFADTFVVNSTGDQPDVTPGNLACATAGGLCTLRAAIQESNAQAGWDLISFNVGGGNAQSIAPASGLPTINGPVTIDGTTQPGFTGNPLIELNGTNAGLVSGLTIGGPDVTVRSLAINRFGLSGIDVLAAGERATVDGSAIGTNGAGTAQLGNGRHGIEVVGERARIGVEGGRRNVISSNAGHGILLRDTADVADIVGNSIGLSRAGNNDFGNALNGIQANGAAAVDIGNLQGRSSPALRNAISGNNGNGIEVTGGTVAMTGNLIGTTLNGTGTLPNSGSGVRVSGDPGSVDVGSTLSAGGNVISGNQGDGVALIGAQLEIISVEGNFIGVSPSGASDFGNTRSGVFLSGASDVTIGGPQPGARNVISGNNGNGVTIAGLSAAGTPVMGNYIGTNADGVGALPNNGDGVFVQAPSVVIGGANRGERNVISGNRHAGVALAAPSASGASLFRNLIGTDVNGSADLGNEADGVAVNGAPSATIGGKDPGQGNVISGNNGDGVQVTGEGATQAVVAGNFIGTNGAGTVDLGNGEAGVDVVNGAPGVTVGGNDAGGGNLIGGNDGHGILIRGATTAGTQILGNKIGFKPPVLFEDPLPLPNAGDGVRVSEAVDTTVGATGPGANAISGNAGHGVGVTSGATGTRIAANEIGLSGTDDVGNSGNGVFLSSAPDTTVGGSDASSRNVISGNGGHGVEITGAPSAGALIQANFIGITSSGSTARPNDQTGVLVNGVVDVEIGGSTAGQGNVIGGNTLDGVAIVGPGANRTRIQGNVIGRSLTQGSANQGNGVRVDNASDGVIGGTGPGEANVIRDNTGDGVLITLGARNRIQANLFDRNDEAAIDLGPDDGVTPNDSGDTDNGANGLQNFPTLASAVTGGGFVTLTGELRSNANTALSMDVYVNQDCDDSGFGEGAQYLGTVALPSTNGSGLVTFTNLDVPGSVAPNSFITVLAIAPTGATSEFSECELAPEAFADVAVTSGASPNPVPLNGTLTYTDVVTNNGPNRALGTVLTQTLGRKLEFQSANPTQGTCQVTARRVTCQLGTVAVNGSVTVTMTARAVETGTAVTNVATALSDVTDPVPENNDVATSINVN